jgi:hypothetical protein
MRPPASELSRVLRRLSAPGTRRRPARLRPYAAAAGPVQPVVPAGGAPGSPRGPEIDPGARRLSGCLGSVLANRLASTARSRPG